MVYERAGHTHRNHSASLQVQMGMQTPAVSVSVPQCTIGAVSGWIAFLFSDSRKCTVHTSSLWVAVTKTEAVEG